MAKPTQAPSWTSFVDAATAQGTGGPDLDTLKDAYFARFIAPNFAEKDRGVARRAFDAQATMPEYSLADEASKAVGRGLNTLGQGLVGSVATGMEAVERNYPGTIAPENMQRIRQMERQQQADRRPYESAATNWDSVQGTKGLGRFLVGNTVEGLATSLPQVVSGGGGVSLLGRGLYYGGTAASAFGTELGQIHADAADRADIESFLDNADPAEYYKNIDTAKMAAGTGAAGSMEFAQDVLLGPFRGLGSKAINKYSPVDLINLGESGAGKAATVIAKGVGSAAGEGITERYQTPAEHWGAGDTRTANPLDLSNPEIRKEANSAGISAFGGALIPGLGGAMMGPKDTTQPPPPGPSYEDQLRAEGIYPEQGGPAAPQLEGPKRPLLEGPSDPGAGPSGPPLLEAPAPTEEELKAKRKEKDLGTVDVLRAMVPDIFDVKKKGDDPNTLLDYTKFAKRVEENWKAQAPMLDEIQLSEAYAEAVKDDPTLEFKKFTSQLKKEKLAEYEQQNPKLAGAQIASMWNVYRRLHDQGIRDFDSATTFVNQFYDGKPVEPTAAPTPASPTLPGASDGQVQSTVQEGQPPSDIATQGTIAPTVTSAVPQPRKAPGRGNKINPETDDLIVAIRRLGGINVDLESDFKGRLSGIETPKIVGLPNVERTNGKGRSLDDLAEVLHEHGYLASRDVGELYQRLTEAEQKPQWALGKQDFSQEQADNGTDRWIEQVDQANSGDQLAEVAKQAGADPRFQARIANDPDFKQRWFDAVDHAQSVFEDGQTPSEAQPIPSANRTAQPPVAPVEQDLFAAATPEEKAQADTLALAERQKDVQRNLNATQAPQGGGLFDQDNRQTEMDVAPVRPIVAKGDPRDREFTAVTRLKGVQDKGDGIYYVPENLMTPQRRNRLMDEAERSKPYISIRVSPTDRYEFKDWAEVTGNPTDRGYAILDRSVRQAQRQGPVNQETINASNTPGPVAGDVPPVVTGAPQTASPMRTAGGTVAGPARGTDGGGVTGVDTGRPGSELGQPGEALSDKERSQLIGANSLRRAMGKPPLTEEQWRAEQSRERAADEALTDEAAGSSIRFQKSSLLDRNAAPKGISRDDAQIAIDSIKAGIPEGTDLVFRIVDEMPEHIRAGIGEGGRAKGYLLPRAQDRDAPNVVVIDRSAHDSVRDAEETLRHEVLGHYGLNLFDATDKRQILDRTLASRRMPSMRKIFKEAERDYPDMGADSTELAEEVFARVAQMRPSGMSKFLEAAEQVIVKGLRKLGLLKKYPTRAELRKIVDAIAEGIRNGARQQTLPANAQAQFQKTAVPEGIQQASRSFTDALKDFWTDKRKTGVNLLLNPHQIAGLNQKYLSAQAYADAAQAMEAQRLHNQRRIAGLVHKLSKLPAAERNATLELMTRSTLTRVNPDVGLNAKVEQEIDGRKVTVSNEHLKDQANGAAAHAKMAAEYRALSPEAKKIYSDIRNHFADTWAQRIETVKNLANETDVPASVRNRLNKDMDALKAKVVGPYFPLMREGRFAVVWKSAKLLAAEDSGDQKAVDALKENKEDYWVQFTDSESDAKRLSTERPEGMAEDAEGYYKIRTVLSREADGASSKFMTALEEALGKKIADTETRSDVLQSVRGVFLETLPELSVMRRTVMRHRVNGVKAEDMMQSIARAGIADAHYLARTTHMGALTDALSNLKKEDAAPRRGQKIDLTTPGTPKGGIGRVYEVMLKSFQGDMLRPEPNSLNGMASKLVGLSYLHSLALDAGNLIANVFQPQMAAAPLMGARFGLGKTEGAMITAFKDAVGAMKFGTGDVDVSKLPEKMGERQAISTLIDQGMIELSQSRELAMVGRGALKNPMNTAWTRTMETLGWASHNVETFSRLATTLAAYRLELQRINSDPNYATKSEQERQAMAVKYASRMSNEALGNYTPGGAPLALRGNHQALTRLALQFKRYAITMLYLYGKTARDAVQGDREAQKTMGLLLGFQFAIGGGLAGLPVALPAQLIAALFPGEDDDESEEEKLDRLALEVAGGDKKLALALRKGPLTALTGIDWGRKMGLQDVLALNISGARELAVDAVAEGRRMVMGKGQVPARGPAKESPAEWTVDNLIPSASSVDRLWHGMQEISNGYLADGIVSFLPKNPFIGLYTELYKEKTKKIGMTNKSGTSTKLAPEAYSDWDIFAKAIGMPLTIESEAWARTEAFNERKQPKADRRADLLERYVVAKKLGETDKVEEIKQDIKAFNESLPDEARKSLRITEADMLSRVQSAKKADKQTAKSGGVTATKKERKWARSVTSPYQP